MKEVGLSAATLRAWEFRYGLPKPQRTAGGQRLYSRQDIEMLKWLVARQNEGLSISHAVELWKSQSATEQAAPVVGDGQVLLPGPGQDVFDELWQKWLAACLAFDDLAANRILDQAFALAAPETICVEVLQKGLAKLGQLWYNGSLSVQQEHFASAIALRRLNSLLAGVVPPSRPGRIIAACPPAEAHDFSLLLVTYLLRRSGWDVVFLGSNVPLQDLDITMQVVSPALVVSAAQTLNAAASLQIIAESLAQQGVPLAYGGGIFVTTPEITHSISGYYLGSEILQVPQQVDRLLKVSTQILSAQPISTEYSRVVQLYKEKKAQIVSIVNTDLRIRQLDPFLQEAAVEDLSKAIESALTLGDINLLDKTSDWLNGLLINHGFPLTLLQQLYTAYQQSLQRALPGEATLILAWLERQLRHDDLASR